MIDEATTAPGIGHNQPDLVTATLRALEGVEKAAPEYLAKEHRQLVDRLNEIRSSLKTVPTKIDDAVTGEKISDLRYGLKKWVSAAKLARTSEKRPWDAVAKVFYAFFTRPIEELEDADAKSLGPILDDWQSREDARKRREAEAEATRLREEADRRAKEAAEAEARRLEAERREREAREAAERAEAEKLAEIKRAAEARIERERQEREAAEAKRRAEEQEKIAAEARARREADEALAEEARAREEEARRAAAEARAAEEAARAAADRARAEESAAKEATTKARAEEKSAIAATVEARKDQRSAGREEREAMDNALRADKKADKQDDIAGAKAADLTRIRGEAGSVSSLRTFKNFRNVDRAKVDWRQIGPHISDDALNTAIRSLIDAKIYTIAGVEVFDDTQTVTR